MRRVKCLCASVHLPVDVGRVPALPSSISSGREAGVQEGRQWCREGIRGVGRETGVKGAIQGGRGVGREEDAEIDLRFLKKLRVTFSTLWTQSKMLIFQYFFNLQNWLKKFMY